MNKALQARLEQMRQSKIGRSVAIAAGSAVALAHEAHAVASASATEATAAVTSTKEDMVLVFGGVLTMAIAIWGIYKIIRIFGGK